jgi:MFS family permease
VSAPGRAGAGPVEAIGFATAALTVATVSLFALPAFADTLSVELALSSAEVGLLTSALALSYAGIQVPAGVLGGVIGINRAFALGLAIFAVGFAGSAMVDSFPALLVLRALTGLGAGMLLPLASALAAAVMDEGDARGQGVLGSGWGLGYVFALLALPLAFDDWRPAFLTLGALALAGAGYALVRLPPARRPDAATALREAVAGLATLAPWLLGACLFGLTVANVGVGAWITVFVQEEHGVGESGAAVLASLIGFGLLPASVAGALVARRIGPRPVVLASCIAMVLSVVLIAVPLGLPALAVGLVLLGFCSGFPFGVILALGGATARGEGRRAQGAMAGAINGIAFLAGVVTPPLVGFVRDESSFAVAFAFLVVGPLLALAAALAALRR